MSRSRARSVLRLAAALVAAPLPAGAGITGVCPDGSMYIVKRAADIPCPDSKRVDPNDVPPIKPHYLPRPYGWERFQRKNDPNNPYNLVTEEPATAGAGAGPERPPPAPPAPPRAAVAAPPVAAPPAPPPALDTTFSEQEIRDLRLLVDLSQRRAPARLARSGVRGQEAAVLQLAHSKAFEARLRERGRPGAGGPVVLFALDAASEVEFWANLTFVQGHVAFHPSRDARGEFGLVSGRLGALAPGDAALGYVVLPETFDLARPLDLYWDDQRLSATLRQ